MEERFEIREGKFGLYFYDNHLERDLPLEKVKYYLNHYEKFRKQNGELKLKIVRLQKQTKQ